MEIVMKKHTRSPLWFYLGAVIFSVIVGILFYYSYGVHPQVVDQQTRETSPSPAISIAHTKQPPTGITIPKIGKQLPVQAANVQGNTWDMFDKSVAWLSTSAVPGEGNVILYAHDWPSLWQDLYKLKTGDTVDVYQNQEVHRYVVFESRAVSANDVDAILSEDNQLTMYTCEGSFDQKRRVVYAKPL